MKKTDFQNKDVSELKQLVEELRAKLLTLQFQSADKKVKDSTQLGKSKKDIARILTALKNKEQK